MNNERDIVARVFMNALFRTFVVIIALVATLQATTAQTDRRTITGAELQSWTHPAKVVLQRNRVRLSEVEIAKPDDRGGGSHYVFHVELPFDPQSGATSSFFNKLYAELFEATGRSGFALDDETDGLRIEISRKGPRGLAVDFVPLH
jgi:hypothetical protein